MLRVVPSVVNRRTTTANTSDQVGEELEGLCGGGLGTSWVVVAEDHLESRVFIGRFLWLLFSLTGRECVMGWRRTQIAVLGEGLEMEFTS